MRWHGLPAIRKEIARSMTDDFGLSQRATAEKLGVTPSAVSQYLSEKRGNIVIDDKVVLQEIRLSAERIIGGEQNILFETCRICKILRTHNQHCFFDDEK